jgi:hypothetical protein
MFYQIFTGLSMELDNLFDQALQGLLDYEANKDRENCLDKSIHIARQVTKVINDNELFSWLLLLACCLRYKVRNTFAAEPFEEAV